MSEIAVVDVPRTACAAEPWPGLASYGEADSELFFGREAESEHLLRFVNREVLTVLFGPSGTGKTSLLNAGLFPKLRAGGFLPVYLRLDHSAESGTHAARIRAALEQAFETHSIEREEIAPAASPKGEETLWEYLHRVVLWDRRNNPVIPMLVFDQFEEIFTLGRNRAASAEFLTDLADLVENYIPQQLQARLAASGQRLPFGHQDQRYKVILSLRADFVSGLDALRQAMPSVMHNRYGLERMGKAQAMLAVLKPGRGLVDEPVAREIVAFVAGSAQPGASGNIAAPHDQAQVEPALLNVVCRELNTLRLSQGKPTITSELLEAARGDILDDFYERGLQGLDPAARVFVEDQLLTGSGFRSTAPVEEALAGGLTDEVIRKLVDRRLLRIEERLGIPHVELTHDVLARVVQKSRNQRHEREQRERRERDLAEQEARRKAELRRVRRIGLIIGVFALASIVFGAMATFAWLKARRATDEANRAKMAAEAAKENTIKELIAATWKMGRYFSDSKRYESGNTYIFGVRAILNWLDEPKLLSLEKLETNLGGLRVFLSGPHGASGFNLQADSFGYYNPEFVRWAAANLVPAATDSTLRELTQPFYKGCLRETARGYYEAYRYISRNPELRDRAAREYLEVIRKHRQAEHTDFLDAPSSYLQETFRPYAEEYAKRVEAPYGEDRLAFYIAAVGCGFWVRRHIDGTDVEFANLLEKVLQTYDAQWLKGVESASTRAADGR